MIMLKLLKDFAAQTCADKQAEIDLFEERLKSFTDIDLAKNYAQLQLLVGEKNSAIEIQDEQIAKDKDTIELMNWQYEKLKARADKMLEALVGIYEVSAHKPRGSDPWQAFEDCQEIALEAIKNDESIDKGNK